MGTWKKDKSKFRIFINENYEFTFVPLWVWVLQRPPKQWTDYENGDSEFGIDNEEDNLFDNVIPGYEIQQGFLVGF